MKVSVNHDLCEGHGKCEASAPAIFEVRDDDLSHVLVDDVPPDQLENVEKAIRLCPRAAISWVQES
jgi:ferredoxin